MKRSEWTTGDDNVVRLLGQVNDPPTVSAAFARRVQARLLEVAAERARPRRRARWVALAAMVALLALATGLLPRSHAPSPSPATVQRDQHAAEKKTPILSLGSTLATRRDERRRVALLDGSVLSLNEGTIVHYDDNRHLELVKGEMFVEVAPRRSDKAAALFTVATPHREIQAVGTKFLVRADDDGTGIAVAQGHVHVSDWDGLLGAGQQLTPQGDAVAPTPRWSYLLDWTRDLIATASPSLVPPSAHSGGALVAVDPQGQTTPLSLRKYHIDVHIEDGFARTTIDQTYFNRTRARLEGTFFFPLPADASLSRLAMYVDGQLMEGGMVERDYGRMVFDRIVTKMKDPALLEWVDGHTFKMRVFPLEPRQEKRIVLSYTQRLPNLYGRMSYRFPAGHSLGAVKEWSFHACVKNGAKVSCRCDSHHLTQQIDNNDDLLLEGSGKQVMMDRDLVLDLMEASGGERVRFSTATQDGFRYLMLRYRPKLPGAVSRKRRDWVFLFESSAERDPLLARTQVEIVRTLLSNAERDDTFAVLSVGTQIQAFAPSPQKATPENVVAVLSFLEKSHLLGALDLDAGLTAAAELLNRSEHPVLVHLGSGRTVLGERRADVLASRIPRRACYVGVGVGKRWARDFMHRAAERCQGYVTEINPDEPVAWRAFELLATLNTPRWAGVRVADLAEKVPFLCPTSFVAQGEELCALARLPADAPLPESLRITGTFDGEQFREVLPVASLRPNAAYLPRTWARLEIDRLLAEDAVKNKQTIIALSKAMYVMTPYTSLLVLENEAMYAQYRVDRGRQDHWAMYPCPAKIPVVSEPLSPNERIEEADRDRLHREYDQLGFFPPAMALNVKGGGGIHTRAKKLNIDAENNQLGFFPPAMSLAVRGTSTIHTRASNLIVPADMDNGMDGVLPNIDTTSAIGGLSSSIGGMAGTQLGNQFSGRSAGTIKKMLSDQGGNAVSEAAVARGLHWLAHHQADDGHWSAHDFAHHARTKPLPGGKACTCNCDGASEKTNDILATAAGVLPFLGAGITHQPTKTRNTDYTKTVAGALYYLVDRQNERDGSWEGGLYAHAFATMAMCEAYGLTLEPKVKRSAQRALNYLSIAQDRQSGGWNEQPGDDGNLFVTGWVILALKSGQMAGLSVSSNTLKRAERFLDAFELPTKGVYAARPGGTPEPLATAMGLLCRQYSGVGPKNPGLRTGLERLWELPPDQTTDVEYLFFATHVMHNFGGLLWNKWNEEKSPGRGSRDVLISRLDKGTTPSHAHQRGSWTPDAHSHLQGGRIVSTALSLLCLEIYYCCRPLYSRNSTTIDSSIFYGESLQRIAFSSLSLDAESVPDVPQTRETQDLVTALLADPRQAKRPSVWRQAACGAEQRKQLETALQYLEKALELEGPSLGDLPSRRRDFSWYMRLAQQRVQGFVARRRSVPRELLKRIMAVADRWRREDPEDWRACWLVGRFLILAGERETAWSYLTSPSMLQIGEARYWIELARQQHWRAEYAFAERAFAVAMSLEPNNPAIIWERALNHRAAGSKDAAGALFRLYQLCAERAREEKRK